MELEAPAKLLLHFYNVYSRYGTTRSCSLTVSGLHKDRELEICRERESENKVIFIHNKQRKYANTVEDSPKSMSFKRYPVMGSAAV
jgi:hypothetical protein